MKNYGHIIAKFLLIIPLSLLFIIIGVMMKNIPESNIIEQHKKSLSMPTTTFFDRMDRWFELKSDEFYYAIKPMSINNIVIYSIMLSTIIVLLMDITIGVGRSRHDEIEELKKQGLL